MIKKTGIFFGCLSFFLQMGLSTPVFSSDIPSLLEEIRFKDDIVFCDIKIPVDDPYVRENLEKEMLVVLWNRAQILLWIKRSTRYFPYIEAQLKENNLHEDFKYVPVVESALKPHSRSSKGAVGYWQFIESTGKNYGLRIDAGMDERRNFFKSTRAACNYLNKLKTEFGCNLLALAAYNMGEYGLAAEIKLQETHDFFSLYLPFETQYYIFKLAVVKMIMENPVKYGFDLQPDDYYPMFTYDEINFNSSEEIPISLIARTAKVPFKTIKEMNPEIRGYYLSPGKITVLIPKGSAKYFKDEFEKLFAEYRKMNVMKFHIIKKGESLIGIAAKYHISLSSLLKWNGLNINSVIHPGKRLIVSENNSK